MRISFDHSARQPIVVPLVLDIVPPLIFFLLGNSHFQRSVIDGVTRIEIIHLRSTVMEIFSDPLSLISGCCRSSYISKSIASFS